MSRKNNRAMTRISTNTPRVVVTARVLEIVEIHTHSNRCDDETDGNYGLEAAVSRRERLLTNMFKV